MRILGIGGGFGHDSAAALVVDGEIVAACEEERFTRQKRATRQPAEHCIQACLDAGSFLLRDIECMAVGWNPSLAPQDSRLAANFDALINTNRLANDVRPAVVHVEHHLAHAALAYYTSGYEDAAVLVIDGQGEAVSSTIYHARAGKLRELQRFPIRDSLGFFFAAVTRYVGFSPGSAGKTMGLAALGSATYDFPEFQFEDGGFEVRMRGETKAVRMAGWLDLLSSVFGPPGDRAFRMDPSSGLLRGESSLPTHLHDAAASAQMALERAVLHLAKIALDHTHCSNLVLGGGVALNCSSNGRLRKALPGTQLYVHGAAHDGGTALGAALAVGNAGLTNYAPRRERSLFLGPSFGPGTAIDLARRLGLNVYEASDGPAHHAARLVLEGHIGGWFQGRAEYGPRALGARSIIARTDDRAITRRVNSIKGRAAWRPIAPAMTRSLLKEIGIYGDGLDFMIEARWLTTEPSDLAGVIHADGSLRPLLVGTAEHPFYPLLAELENHAGIRSIVNTSFNLEVEPIVNSPLDALRTFIGSDLDFLVLEGVILEKTS
jgi:carbamoyltransferase